MPWYAPIIPCPAGEKQPTGGRNALYGRERGKKRAETGKERGEKEHIATKKATGKRRWLWGDGMSLLFLPVRLF